MSQSGMHLHTRFLALGLVILLLVALSLLGSSGPRSVRVAESLKPTGEWRLADRWLVSRPPISVRRACLLDESPSVVAVPDSLSKVCAPRPSNYAKKVLVGIFTYASHLLSRRYSREVFNHLIHNWKEPLFEVNFIFISGLSKNQTQNSVFKEEQETFRDALVWNIPHDEAFSAFLVSSTYDALLETCDFDLFIRAEDGIFLLPDNLSQFLSTYVSHSGLEGLFGGYIHNEGLVPKERDDVFFPDWLPMTRRFAPFVHGGFALISRELMVRALGCEAGCQDANVDAYISTCLKDWAPMVGVPAMVRLDMRHTVGATPPCDYFRNYVFINDRRHLLRYIADVTSGVYDVCRRL